MTTLYALPSLNTWDTPTGWSLTSGGASAGAYPTGTDAAIFDANSGSGRTIGPGGTGVLFKSINTSGANGMSFATMSASPSASGDNVNLSTVSSCGALFIFGSSTAACLLTPPPSGVASLYVSGASVTLGAALLCSGTVNLTGFSSATDTFFNTGNYAVTVADIIVNFTTLTLGSSTFTIAGGGSGIAMLAATVLNYGTSTVVFSYTSSAGTIDFRNVAHRLYNVVNACTGNSYLRVVNSGNVVGFRCAQLKMMPGSAMRFPTAVSSNIDSLLADGTSSTVTMLSATPGTRANVTVGAAAVVDRCNITDMSMSQACRARSSVDGGNNVNWTFVPNNSRLLQFF